MIPLLRSEISIVDVIKSALHYRGYGQTLQTELVGYFGVKQALLTHSGRTGLYFLLKALPQKKVYLPAYNCWVVTEAVRYAKKEIEYVDINLDDYTMDVAKLAEVLVPESIIIATHQFGIPCNIEAILEVAKQRKCFVIEDNAPAFGSEYKGKKTGSFCDASFISFDYSKLLVSGKGGAVLFNDEELYHRVKTIHDNEIKLPGFFKSLKHMLIALSYSYATHELFYPLTYVLFKKIRGLNKSFPSYNFGDQNESYRYGYDDMRAKLAYLGMKRLEKTIQRRKEILDCYLKEVVRNENIIPINLPDYIEPVMLKLPFRLKNSDREYFYKKCLKKGLDIAFLFPYFYEKNGRACLNARIAADQAMALPIYSSLKEADLLKIKGVFHDKGNFGSDLVSRNEIGAAEKRRILFFTLSYYWLDKEAYLKSKNSISVLKSYDELPVQEYFLKVENKSFLIDLFRSNEEIFSAFDYKGAQYPIHKTIKNGVIVNKACSSEEKKNFYDFYQTFVKDPKRKNKILVLQKSELEKLEVFYAVSAQGEYLGGIGLLPSPDRRYLYYKYAATLHRFSENDLLIWNGIKYAKDEGYAYFDLSCVCPEAEKKSDLYRLYHYKKKFGGSLVTFNTYVKVRKPFGFLEIFFSVVLRYLFQNDLIKFVLFLKKLKMFK